MITIIIIITLVIFWLEEGVFNAFLFIHKQIRDRPFERQVNGHDYDSLGREHGVKRE